MREMIEESCGKCKFWEGRPIPEFSRSRCLRNAPSTYRGGHDAVYDVLASILWAVNQSKGVGHRKHMDWEATASHSEAFWPYTEDEEWCGEFVAGKNRSKTVA